MPLPLFVSTRSSIAGPGLSWSLLSLLSTLPSKSPEAPGTTMVHSQQTALLPPLSDMEFLHFPSSPPINWSTLQSAWWLPPARISIGFLLLVPSQSSPGLLTSSMASEHLFLQLCHSKNICQQYFYALGPVLDARLQQENLDRKNPVSH